MTPLIKTMLHMAAILPLIAVPPANGQTLEHKVDSLMAIYNKPNVPGASIAVFQNGKIRLAKSYGAANIEAKVPATSTTNYRLASVTKQFTAMCIIMLEQQGKLSYDDPIAKYFHDFPDIGQTITIRHLLWHTSGLVDYEDLLPPGLNTQLKDKDVLDLVSRQHGTYFTPGTQYRYSNTGYALLALIVERVSHLSFADFLEQRIFRPLNMSHTLAYENGVSTVANRAMGCKQADSGFVDADQSLTSAVLGDGGIYTSIDDYFKWDTALYSDKLVPRKSLEAMFTPGHLADGTPTNYGFGWRVEEKYGTLIAHHNGGTSGFNNAVRRAWPARTTVLVLTNRRGGPAREIADQLIQWLLTEQNDRDKP